LILEQRRASDPEIQVMCLTKNTSRQSSFFLVSARYLLRREQR
jgi:hypothetical protein